MTLNEVIEQAKNKGLEVERNGATYTISEKNGKRMTLKNWKGHIKIQEDTEHGVAYFNISDEKIAEYLELLVIYNESK